MGLFRTHVSTSLLHVYTDILIRNIMVGVLFYVIMHLNLAAGAIQNFSLYIYLVTAVPRIYKDSL